MRSLARIALSLLAAQLAASQATSEAYEAPSPDRASAAFVGSAACQSCHPDLFDAWAATRHARSVLSPEHARSAGYPPPPAPAAWPDIAHVIGGRQRIAYADRAGRVLGSAYHQRLSRFGPFPTRAWSDCGPCHATGHPPANQAGTFVEQNIGCEACHGPGAAHARSQEARDIAVDPSSRTCGTCHTAVGKVLPADDVHATHDLVQTWNRDPHVLGVRFQSHNAFCADCHSPWERGDFGDRAEGAARRVFSESKHEITCIGCHDPHATSHPRYGRDPVYLGAPLPVPRQVYRGNDADFTTRDFDRFETTEAQCRDCHRGADRIELDHAGATCTDCHNPFQRNRSTESRPFRDANHKRVSCRPCHADADHLVSLLYRDDAFLEPRHVHDLRRLPAAAVARHGFRYPATRPRRISSLPPSPGALFVREEMSAAALRKSAARQARPGGARLEAVEDLARGPATRERLAQASDGDSPLFRQLLFAAGGSRAALAEPVATGTRDPWLEGLLALASGRFAEASAVLEPARAREPANAALAVQLGLAQLGEGRRGPARATLEAVVDRPDAATPARSAAHIALAAIAINADRLADAREHLEAARRLDPRNGLAAYFLGRVLLREREPMEAAAAFRAAVEQSPEDLNAWFHLARAYRAGRHYGAAVDTYGEMLRREPGLFDAHHDLALLYKKLSDDVATSRKRAAERARPPGIGPLEWRRYLAQLERRVGQYSELALAAFGRADAIRPLEPPGVLQVADIYRRARRFEEAREQLERLARSEPGEWLHRYRLGTIAVQEGAPQEAIAHLEGALQLSPGEGDVYVALGLAYARAGRADEAVDTLERGRVHEPFNPALYTNLGAAYLERGDALRARGALERALALRTFPLPRSHLAHTNLALAHGRQGRHDEAARALDRALHVFPDYPYAGRLREQLRAGDDLASARPVYDDLLERFGETGSVEFPDEPTEGRP